ncbi:hypothetical protein [Ancylobacter terrae]|uniref:hypothetical protein n=1 Tax=Ancylobacter sp. sgz301288 TaxID=3342077 RepID=UPI00385CA2C9
MDDTESGGDFDPPFVARVRLFGEEEGNLVDAPEGYAENFDKELGSAVAESLCNYLIAFAAENDRKVAFTLEENEIRGEREDGSSISISCYTPELFDLQRWPSIDETVANDLKIIFDLANGLNADIMVYLARRFIINGHLDD